jgi:hypothetical protein
MKERRSARILARFVLSVALATLVLLSVVGSASAAVMTVEFSRGTYVAPLGQALPDPISVTVKDENGDPVSGVVVAFSVTPDSTGATAAISASTATTDANGVAQITGTAGAQAGFPRVHADADGALSEALIVNRPPGYRPGEQLASIVAQNQDGVTQNVRDSLDNKSYLLVDVCAGWCGPCKNFAEATQAAITQLALVDGVSLKLVTLLMQGGDQGDNLPSTQADAAFWKADHGLTDPVFHAGGSASSALYRGAGFFLYDNDPQIPSGAFPTHLLVDPKGNILDRRVGGETTQQTIDRVLAFVKAKKKPPKPPKVLPAGQVGVQLPDGETHSDFFQTYDSHMNDWGGTVSLNGDDGATTVSRFWSYFRSDTTPLPATGTLTTSLTRFKADAKQPLASSSVQVVGFMQLGTDYVGALTTLPAVQRKDTVTVAADLAALRTALRAKLDTGEFFSIGGEDLTLTPPLSEQDKQALVDSLFGLAVNAQYNIATK